MARLPASALQHSAGALLTVGVVTDTHIPDRAVGLHPLIIPLLREARVAHILHAGDVSVQAVLDELAQVAPVTAARGNRDLLLPQLPLVQMLELGGVQIAVMHGHGGWGPYVLDKWQFIFFGYQFKRYRRLLLSASGAAQVVVFGHTHRPETVRTGGKLLFNPGAAGVAYDPDHIPSMGLLYIYPGGRVEAESLPLTGYEIRARQWVEK